MLYIVPTPLGNLKDITFRAVEILESADFIIAENPTHSQKLLQHYKISKKPIHQFAEHNEQKVLDKLVNLLKTQTGAIITDAGTPGISDPGFRLVRGCREAGIEITSIPGASAVITALAGSGLPTDKFVFIGFFPKTEIKVGQLLEESKNIRSTLVGYDSPERIIKTLGFIEKHSPDAQVVVARELTKMHEEYLTGTAGEIIKSLKTKTSVKGEITLLISFK
jgi:16S rRNA (cytidine1402-2'-O)-methyltransferase